MTVSRRIARALLFSSSSSSSSPSPSLQGFCRNFGRATNTLSSSSSTTTTSSSSLKLIRARSSFLDLSTTTTTTSNEVTNGLCLQRRNYRYYYRHSSAKEIGDDDGERCSASYRRSASVSIRNNRNYLHASAFVKKARQPSSSSDSKSSTNTNNKALIVDDDDEFDELTDKWIPEKPVTKAETAGYSVVIVVGLGLAAAALFFASKELFITPKEYIAFNEALKKIERDTRVTSALGGSLTGYGSESRNRSQRQRIPHSIVRDPATGREIVRVQFHCRGSRGNAIVHAEYDQENIDEPFGYIIVDVERPRQMRIVVQEPRKRKSIMGPGTSLVG